jgi:hypothetical protein
MAKLPDTSTARFFTSTSNAVGPRRNCRIKGIVSCGSDTAAIARRYGMARHRHAGERVLQHAFLELLSLARYVHHMGKGPDCRCGN